jgi:hypothetical protein
MQVATVAQPDQLAEEVEDTAERHHDERYKFQHAPAIPQLRAAAIKCVCNLSIQRPA